MKGYKVSMETLDGRRRVDCFTGFLKTKEDAEKYAEWIGESAEIKEYTRKKISTYAIYDETSDYRLRYI